MFFIIFYLLLFFFPVSLYFLDKKIVIVHNNYNLV